MNKVILKNTMFLYIRMVIVTIISLYTVRITLEVLGLEDYGLFNLIGGIIGLLSIITTTLTTSTQRFFSYELGKEGHGNYSDYFSISIIIYVGIAVILLLLSEFLIPRFFLSKLQIPSNRIESCVKVFNICLMTFSANLIVVPFSSSIIAHEKMSFYAYLSVVESAMKLIMIYFLVSIKGDKLVIYTWLLFGVSIIVLLSNILYCRSNFNVCKFKWRWDGQFIKQFFLFTGWNSIAAITSVLSVQGVTIIINFFFGPIANAAKAISDKIFSTVFLLVSNIILAATPQMTKEVATKEYEKMIPAFYSISRMSFFLILVIAIPCCMSMRTILTIWLGKDDCTELMVKLSQITLLSMLFSSLETPISMIVRANGHIRSYQIINGFISILLIPLTLLVYLLNFPPYSYAIIQALLLLISLFPRIYILKKLFPNLTIEYYRAVIKPILNVSVVSLALVFPVYYILNFHNSICLFGYSAVSVIGSIYILGTSVQEKEFIKKIILSKIELFHKK